MKWYSFANATLGILQLKKKYLLFITNMNG